MEWIYVGSSPVRVRFVRRCSRNSDHKLVLGAC